MKILTIYPGTVNERLIGEAVDVMRDGGIIVYPTDTLYALGCDALNQKAIQRLCRVKKLNPDKNQLSVVCSGLSQASEYVRIDNTAYRLTSSAEVGDDWDLTNAESIAMCYDNDCEMVIDGGEGGETPSTVVDLTDPHNPVVVRDGLGEFAV